MEHFPLFIPTCWGGRISYGLNAQHCCRPEYCSQKTVARRQLPGHTGKFSSLDMTGMNCPFMFAGLISLSNIAALIPSMTQFCSQLSPCRGKHARQNENSSVSLSGGGSCVIGMTTHGCITDIRSLKLQTKDFVQVCCRSLDSETCDKLLRGDWEMHRNDFIGGKELLKTLLGCSLGRKTELLKQEVVSFVINRDYSGVNVSKYQRQAFANVILLWVQNQN